MKRLILLIVAGSCSSLAMADMCKYQDPQGNLHYQNTPPQPGWTTIECGVTDEKPSRLAEWRSAQAVRSKVKIGMTRDQLRGVIRYPNSRRAVETSSGTSEWLEFPYFSVLMRNGRVAAISD